MVSSVRRSVALGLSPPPGCYNFNRRNTARLRHALRYGGVIATPGTSLTAAYGSGTGDPPVEGAQPLSWPVLLADKLSAIGIPAKQTARWGDSNYGSAGSFLYDPRVTLGSSNWNVSNAGPGGSSWLNTADTANFSFDQGFDTDTAKVWYQQNTGLATWKCEVGGAQVGSNIVANNTPNSILSTTFNTTLGDNTWDFSRVSGGGFRIEGVEAYDSTIANLVRIWPMGWGGVGTTQWISTAAATSVGSVLATLPVDCWVIELTGNDMHAELAHATAQSQLTTMDGLCSTLGGDVIHVIWPGESTALTSEATQGEYNRDVAAVAKALGRPYVSWREWFGGSFAASPANYSDSIHMSDVGQDVVATMMTQVMRYVMRL